MVSATAAVPEASVLDRRTHEGESAFRTDVVAELEPQARRGDAAVLMFLTFAELAWVVVLAYGLLLLVR